MKKTLVSILAFLLAAAMLIGFAACGKREADAPTTAGGAAAETTQTTEPAANETDEPAGGEASAHPGETATGDIAAIAEGEDVPNPIGMAKPELVAWYNDRINYVREQKPKMTRAETLEILSVEVTLLGGLLDGIINAAIKRFMPGDPVVETIQKGTDNREFFMGSMERPIVRPGDAQSITAKEEGGNYVVTLLLGSEINPLNDGVSKYSRISNPATRQDVLDTVSEMGITGDIEKAVLLYHGGKVVITVNQKGEIVHLRDELYVDADCKDVKASVFKTDLTAKQHGLQVFTGFVY